MKSFNDLSFTLVKQDISLQCNKKIKNNSLEMVFENTILFCFDGFMCGIKILDFCFSEPLPVPGPLRQIEQVSPPLYK